MHVVSFYNQPRNYTDKRNQFACFFCQPTYDTLRYAIDNGTFALDFHMQAHVYS